MKDSLILGRTATVGNKIIEVESLKYFKTPKGMLHAVDGVDL